VPDPRLQRQRPWTNIEAATAAGARPSDLSGGVVGVEMAQAFAGIR
jgi:hypothetical protein